MPLDIVLIHFKFINKQNAFTKPLSIKQHEL